MSPPSSQSLRQDPTQLLPGQSLCWNHAVRHTPSINTCTQICSPNKKVPSLWGLLYVYTHPQGANACFSKGCQLVEKQWSVFMLVYSMQFGQIERWTSIWPDTLHFESVCPIKIWARNHPSITIKSRCQLSKDLWEALLNLGRYWGMPQECCSDHDFQADDHIYIHVTVYLHNISAWCFDLKGFKMCRVSINLFNHMAPCGKAFKTFTLAAEGCKPL